MTIPYSKPETVAREYYNSDSADRFYESIWGGEDIHVGLYQSPEESIFDASRRTVERMASVLPGVTSDSVGLDVGSGYGGSARYLAKRFGCRMTCLNLSEVQNQRNRDLNRKSGLDPSIEVIDGSFEELPFPDRRFDFAWSQDAILHSGRRERVLAEIDRVLQPAGHFVFTDPMQHEGCPSEALAPVLARIHLQSMGSPEFYRRTASQLGWKEGAWIDLSEQLTNHYARVRQEVVRREAEVVQACGAEYVERMKAGLQHWVDTGRNGHLRWGIFLFQKPALSFKDGAPGAPPALRCANPEVVLAPPRPARRSSGPSLWPSSETR
jgi:sarcosine/dimethylglycine N-methyltransferase